jgi:hypothetical protein
MVNAHRTIEKKPDITGDILGDIRVRHNSGLAVVTPASAIMDLINREDVVEERDRTAKISASEPDTELDVLTP